METARTPVAPPPEPVQAAQQSLDLVGGILRPPGASERRGSGSAARATHAARQRPTGPAAEPRDDHTHRVGSSTPRRALRAAKHGPQRFRHELINVFHLLAFSDRRPRRRVARWQTRRRHFSAPQDSVRAPAVLSLLNREAPHAKALLLRLAQAHHSQDVLSAAHVFARALAKRRRASRRRRDNSPPRRKGGGRARRRQGCGGRRRRGGGDGFAQAKTDRTGRLRRGAKRRRDIV